MPTASGSIDKVKSRHWCFTLNNPEGGEELYETNAWNAYNVHYMIVGFEIGESGTPHHQGYVHWENPRFGRAMRKLLPRARWMNCRGSERQNYVYCSKDGNLVLECGKRGATHDDDEPVSQGKRTDLDTARTMVEAGASWEYIVAHVTSYSALRVAAEYLTVAEPPRTWKTSVMWIYGPTGTGKTTLATELCQSRPWVSGRTAKWFDGYDAHEDVIFDEFRGDFCTFHELLRFFDKLELRVEIKRGSRQFKARRIFVTSCLPPHRAYSRCDEELMQLGRRIDQIVWIPERNKMFSSPGSAIGKGDPMTPFVRPVPDLDQVERGNNEPPHSLRSPGGSPAPREDNLLTPDTDTESLLSELDL